MHPMQVAKFVITEIPRVTDLTDWVPFASGNASRNNLSDETGEGQEFISSHSSL